jgi:hypothetical protein
LLRDLSREVTRNLLREGTRDWLRDGTRDPLREGTRDLLLTTRTVLIALLFQESILPLTFREWEVPTEPLDEKVLAELISGVKSSIVHKLEHTMGYYFEPSEKPPLKEVLVRHLVALNGRRSTVTCFLSSLRDAKGGDFTRIVSKTDASESVLSKSDTDDEYDDSVAKGDSPS